MHAQYQCFQNFIANYSNYFNNLGKMNNDEPCIYLIRHAKSAYNVAEAQIKKKYAPIQQKQLRAKPEYNHMKYEHNYEDCDVVFDEETLKQIQECKQKLDKIDIDLVVVSPLRRTIVTCGKLLQGRKDCPRVIVDPNFREVMSSRCDIGSRLRQSIKDYPNFDYSLIKDIDFWYVHTLKNKVEAQKILNEIKKVEDPQKANKSLSQTLKYIKNIGQQRKTNPNAYYDLCSPIQRQKQILNELLKKYKNIVVVTHNYNIELFIGSKSPNLSIFKYPQSFFKLSD